VSFPSDFAWGAAAAAYQIEGAAKEDGKGPSVWDTFCRNDGSIRGGHSGEVACDHYHRFRQDVALMKQIGLKAYRLSISWPRVLPSGTGEVNPKGIDFYEQLIDECLAAGITPYVTLFHWDLPQTLYDRRGWLNRESADWFAQYAAVVADRLSDRVTYWMTINEPQVFLSHGHLDGIHAPGDNLPLQQVLQAGHHLLLAHGKAVQAIRATSSKRCQVGYAPMGLVKIPASTGPEDVQAARRAMLTVAGGHLFNNTWWMDPVFLGAYPQDGLTLYGQRAPEIRDGDMDLIAQPLDFLGMNTYSGETVRAGPSGEIEQVLPEVGHQATAYRWPVTPEALYWGPKVLYERYKLPLWITENGMSNTDWVSLDGRVHDPQRIDFMQRYLLQLSRAIQDGVDVRGYFYWSILDNFEWAEGYRERFGLIHVDYSTQQRTLKDSAYWYKDVIASNGEHLATPHAHERPTETHTPQPSEERAAWAEKTEEHGMPMNY
jgi:beta-glucosidase